MNPGNLVSMGSGPTINTPQEWVHAVYDDERDKAQQLGMLVSFQDRLQQGEPERLAVMMYFRKGSPLYGNGKQNCGGPVLGWPDFPVVQASGAEHYRFYTKDTIGADINIELLTPEVMAALVAEGDRIKATLAPGDDRKICVGLKASSDKFKEDYPGPRV
jgi:hypothetical protein